MVPTGLDLEYRHAKIDGHSGGVKAAGLSMYRDVDGVTRLDQLHIDGLGIASMHMRPDLGDAFDLALLFGQGERVWYSDDLGWGQWTLFSPLEVTFAGLSNTDQDDDRKVKHYLAAGLGVGASVLGRLAGPLGGMLE